VKFGFKPTLVNETLNSSLRIYAFMGSAHTINGLN